jgi:hypothetical protein
LIKSAFILFLTCFLLYLPFSRHPDFVDSETAPAVIKYKGDTIVAEYSEYGKPYFVILNDRYKNRVGERVEVLYELRAPENAIINTIWGYWLVPIELAWSFGVFLVLLGVAYATTNKPHDNAVKEQLNYKQEQKTKYE